MSPNRLRQEIGSLFTVVKERCTNEEIYIVCPVPGCPDKTGNRSINLKTGKTYCWHCRDKSKGNFFGWAKHLGYTVSQEEAHQVSREELAALIERKEEREPLTPLPVDLKLPAGFKLLSENRKSCYWRFIREMAERKNLTIEDFEAVGAGFVREGAWEPFCIFPVREYGQLVYYQGRTYDDEGVEVTKKFPNKRDVPLGSKYWVYNLNALAPATVEVAIIVESVLNVLSLRKRLPEWMIPVGTFTHHISRSQLAKFLRFKHVKEFCLLYDSDSTADAWDAADHMAGKLPISVAVMPTGQNSDGTVRVTNDANDDVEAALEAISQRQWFRRSVPIRLRGEKKVVQMKNFRATGPMFVLGL